MTAGRLRTIAQIAVDAFRPYNVGAPPGGLPMSPDTFASTAGIV